MFTNHIDVSTSTEASYTLSIAVDEADYNTEYLPLGIIINVDSASGEILCYFKDKNDTDGALCNGLKLKAGTDYYFGSLDVPVHTLTLAPVSGTAICTVNCFRFIRYILTPKTHNPVKA